MKQLYFSVLLMITVLQCLCQPEIEYPVCSIDDKPVPPRIIAAQAVDLTSNNVLRDYLREIKSKLLLNHAPFFLKNIQERKTACALNLKNGNVIERVIALNEAYYSLLVPNTRLSKATFVWIIGHEITHHINSDHFYLSEKDALKNISKEVLCDENAGYLVGALTSDVSLNDVATILNSILRNNDTSMYYPPLKYRIHAAQA